MEDRADLRALMGEDLWALACSVGQEPVKAQLVTPLPSRGAKVGLSHRAAFRVSYADGLLLKARRHRDPDTAERVSGLRSLLDPRHLPALVAERGSCHLTEWVAGESPSPDDMGVLGAAGALLGKMHAAEIGGEALRHGFEFRHWEGRNRRNAHQLSEAGALTPAEVDLVLERLAEMAPAHSRGVVIHADLAPENLIVSPDGELILVDNENLAVDAPGFDLARTWYRWPMNESRSAAFLAGYRSHADPAPFLEFDGFWTMVVLLEAAHFRVLRDTPDASVPLDRLRAMIAGSFP